jgi:hypothetical protein
LEFSSILDRQNWLDVRGFYRETDAVELLEFVYRPYLPDAVELDDTMGSFDSTEFEESSP